MTKKISDMSLDELQDYCLSLENDNQSLRQLDLDNKTKIAEMHELNVALQRRNNQLFLSVEQGIKPQPTTGESETPRESIEDFARKLGGIIK